MAAIKFGTGYRFTDETGVATAHVDSTGKLWIKSESGGLESWESPQEWLKEVLKVTPEKTAEQIVNQLAEAFGTANPISDAPAAPSVPSKKPVAVAVPATPVTPATPATQPATGQKVKETDTMANKPVKQIGSAAQRRKQEQTHAASKASPKAAAKAKAPAKVKAPAGPLPECQCGCGNKVLNAKRNFLQGHDARFHGYIKKYERGLVKLGELPALVQSHIRREGIKAGSAKA